MSDDVIIRQADDIASQITAMLVDAFRKKESRDPTPEEVEQLIEEMTEERIEELFSGADNSAAAGLSTGSDEEGEDSEEDEDAGSEEEGDEPQENDDTAKPVAVEDAAAGDVQDEKRRRMQ